MCVCVLFLILFFKQSTNRSDVSWLKKKKSSTFVLTVHRTFSPKVLGLSMSILENWSPIAGFSFFLWGFSGTAVTRVHSCSNVVLFSIDSSAFQGDFFFFSCLKTTNFYFFFNPDVSDHYLCMKELKKNGLCLVYEEKTELLFSIRHIIYTVI